MRLTSGGFSFSGFRPLGTSGAYGGIPLDIAMRRTVSEATGPLGPSQGLTTSVSENSFDAFAFGSGLQRNACFRGLFLNNSGIHVGSFFGAKMPFNHRCDDLSRPLVRSAQKKWAELVKLAT